MSQSDYRLQQRLHRLHIFSSIINTNEEASKNEIYSQCDIDTNATVIACDCCRYKLFVLHIFQFIPN